MRLWRVGGHYATPGAANPRGVAVSVGSSTSAGLGWWGARWITEVG